MRGIIRQVQPHPRVEKINQLCVHETIDIGYIKRDNFLVAQRPSKFRLHYFPVPASHHEDRI